MEGVRSISAAIPQVLFLSWSEVAVAVEVEVWPSLRDLFKLVRRRFSHLRLRYSRTLSRLGGVGRVKLGHLAQCQDVVKLFLNTADESLSLFSCRGPHKVEEACEMYCRAANMFKMAKNWTGALCFPLQIIYPNT